MGPSAHLVALISCISSLVILLSLPSPAVASQQLLVNSGFEQGLQGWAGGGISTGCTGRSGGGALISASGSELSPFLQQTVQPIAPGVYTLGGYAKMIAGASPARVSLAWKDAGGGDLGMSVVTFAPGAAYESFSLGGVTAPAQAGRVVVKVELLATASASLCVDDLSLDGPTLATATPTPSATPTATSSPIPTPSLTPTPLATATATRTPAVRPAATSTRPAATVASVPSAAGAFASSGFSNGGFEAGITGWSKFGGELGTVGSPVHSGAAAGRFSSATSSTKWVYQTLSIDPAQAYEFAGYLWPDAGVAAAYLRISWYTSADGSGQAIASDDSTGRLSPSAGAFGFLTTGPVLPPPGTRSARARVLMAPLGASAASLYLDDFSFDIAKPETAVASRGVPATEEIAGVAGVGSPGRPEVPGGMQETAAQAIEDEVAGVRLEPTPDATFTTVVPTDDDRGFPWLTVGLPAAFVAFALAYVYARRNPQSDKP